MLRKLFSQNLKKYRLKKDISQMQLAVKSEISLGALASLEQGRNFPSEKNIKKLALALGIREIDFFKN